MHIVTGHYDALRNTCREESKAHLLVKHTEQKQTISYFIINHCRECSVVGGAGAGALQLTRTRNN